MESTLARKNIKYVTFFCDKWQMLIKNIVDLFSAILT